MKVLALILFFALVSVALVTGAAPRGGGEPSPSGKVLPSVAGNALDGTRVRFPEDLSGRHAVLLVAYRRGTQPDVDRWMSLLRERAPSVPFYEVPTITGAVWRAMQGWIDSGMRGGVPKENWPRVVTLYEDAATLRDFLGDSGGLRTHVVLVDPSGKVVWFHGGGYGEEAAASLLEALAAASEGTR